MYKFAERIILYMILSELFSENEILSPEELPAVEIRSITTDSRKAVADSLFVCLRGSFTDGHMYIDQAYYKGCRCFLCEKEVELPEDAVVIYTKDTRKLLAYVSARFYGFPSKELKIIGITGTKGKTTSALMITQIMNSCGLNCGYIGSNGVYFNNSSYKTENTTPESLILQRILREMADNGVKYVALEVSSQALHTYRVECVDFDTVVFTNLARDHIGKYEHPTYQHYIESKASLFTKKYRANMCVCNVDDMMYDVVTGKFSGKTVSYSVKGKGDVNAENIKYYSSNDGIGIMFDVRINESVYPAFLPIPGDFNVQNALCAFCVCMKYTDDAEAIVKAMAKVKVDGRLEMYHSKKGFTFVIDYAHNGLSLACALSELRKYCNGKLICLFGSVGDRTRERRQELGEAAGKYADFCIITSDNPGYEAPHDIIADIARYVRHEGCEYVSMDDRETAIRYAYRIAQKNDIILLAGKGHETYQLIKNKKVPFSEKKIVAELLEAEKRALKSN